MQDTNNIQKNPEVRFSAASEAGIPEARLDDPKVVARAKQLWEEKGTDSPFFKKWFGDSKVVGEDGKPLVAYHGSGTAITEFKPELTGLGFDQLGSGFYFTSRKETADNYQTRRNPNNDKKLGGEDNPTTVSAYLNIQKPIILGAETESLIDIKVTPMQYAKILSQSDPSNSGFPFEANK
jgi:hypothetical protein